MKYIWSIIIIMFLGDTSSHSSQTDSRCNDVPLTLSSSGVSANKIILTITLGLSSATWVNIILYYYVYNIHLNK